MATFETYKNNYAFMKMERENGLLEVTFHTNGGPLIMSDDLHANIQYAWRDIGSDPENKVIILTGTGDVFCVESDDPGNFGSPSSLSLAARDAKNMYESFFDIDAIVISAVNGPAFIHTDLLVTADVVIAAEEATFADFHVAAGMVTGGIAQVIWMELLGYVRGKYFLLTGQTLTAQQALACGVVNEIVKKEDLLTRARTIAHGILKQPATTIRNTRRAINQRIKQRFLEEAPLGYTLISLGLINSSLKKEQLV
jgi:enoyl-CoA hydratase/carnithine racemase